MAETANIARMAEIIASEIFEEFGWKKSGPMNANWDCVDQDNHKVQTHPSDVVFFYDEPYRNVRTYVQTDLKSYAKDTISKSILEKSIKSLAMQVACANNSPEWQGQYSHSDVSYDICGMLFVFNHDGGFDRTFVDLLVAADTSEIDLPEGSKIVVLGPEDVYWLHNVAQEITRMRGRQGANRLPDREHCSFFYPQPVRKVFLRSDKTAAASLEILTGPWIMMKYEKPLSPTEIGYVIFYRGEGETSEEFYYLIDYVRQHELLRDGVTISIKSVDKQGAAQNNFQKAKQQFIEHIGVSTGTVAILKIISSITFEPIRALVPHFSETAIGMEYDR